MKRVWFNCRQHTSKACFHLQCLWVSLEFVSEFMIAADEWQSFVWVWVMLLWVVNERWLKLHFHTTPLLCAVSDCNRKPLRVTMSVREADGEWKEELLQLIGARGIVVSYPPLIREKKKPTTFKTTGTPCTMWVVSALILSNSCSWPGCGVMSHMVSLSLSVLPFCTTLHTDVL